jgi:AraC family transcriptional regulator, transcriptional activator FtrA
MRPRWRLSASPTRWAHANYRRFWAKLLVRPAGHAATPQCPARPDRVPAPHRPHHVVTLVMPDVVLLDMAAPAQIFGYLGSDTKVFGSSGPGYSFELAGVRRGQVRTSSGLPVVAARGLEALDDADTIVVPGFSTWATAHFPAAAAAVARAHQRGTRIMSICTGALVLAEAGLLDGRRATTHWCAVDLLAQRHPAVTVDPDVLYVDEGSILTSAGVAAGLDLSLHVVRRDHGAAIAADMARWTVISPYREGGQAQFIPASVPATNGRASTARVREWALGHLDQPLRIEDLASRAAMSRRTFARHFKAETGTTAAQWLLEQRLRAAQSLLETTDHPIERVAHETGFNHAAALRAHFTRRLHTTPTAYRRAFTMRNGD